MSLRNTCLLVAMLLLQGSLLCAQDSSEVLMIIGKTPVTKGEFERIYHKNNSSVKSNEQKSLDDYLELFINFKLKVIEAESQGLDTLQSFKTELAGYRDQLAKSYIASDEINEKLVNEAYERSQWEIDVSHILFLCDANATPTDTIMVWNKAIAAYDALKKGADFRKLAAEKSEDPSAKKNNGHLGYLTVFQTVYPFESAAYHTAVGSFTFPFRTRFGYHILKVNSRIPARGQVKASHIMKTFPENATPVQIEKAKKEIFSLYDSIRNGADFGRIAKKYSDDGYTARVNGDLGWFSVGHMIPEFENVAFSLKKPGDYSEPFRTPFGWHIIKLYDRKPVPGFKESKENIEQMIKRDDRAVVSRQLRIAALKKEYGYKDNLAALFPLTRVVDSSIFKGKWDKSKANGLKEFLFSIGHANFTQQDFAAYLGSQKSVLHPIPIENYINQAFVTYRDAAILDYEKDVLPARYPEFRYLMQEYHDGILLFNLTDREVWSKAQKDSAGLEKFFAGNKDKYKWNERLDASIYTCSNDSIAALARTAALQREKKGLDKRFVYHTVCPSDTLMKTLRIEDSKYEKGDNALIDKQTWKKGMSDNSKQDGKVVFIMKRGILRPEPKSLSEARGLVIADYQDFLEKEWVKSLRSKYPVVVKKEVFATVK